MPASPPCSTWIRAAASTPSTCATRSTPAIVMGPRMQVVGQSINQRATQLLPRHPNRALPRQLHREQEHQLALARPRRRARGQAARRRLDQDLHDAGFRRRRCTCGSRDATAGQFALAHLRRSPGDRRRSPTASASRSPATPMAARACSAASTPAWTRPITCSSSTTRRCSVLLEKRLPFGRDVGRSHRARRRGYEGDRRAQSAPEAGGAGVPKAHAAGVPIVFGSGATSARIPHGKQADQFALLSSNGA